MHVASKEIYFLKDKVNLFHIFESTYFNITTLYTNADRSLPKISTESSKILTKCAQCTKCQLNLFYQEKKEPGERLQNNWLLSFKSVNIMKAKQN